MLLHVSEDVLYASKHEISFLATRNNEMYCCSFTLFNLMYGRFKNFQRKRSN